MAEHTEHKEEIGDFKQAWTEVEDALIQAAAAVQALQYLWRTVLDSTLDRRQALEAARFVVGEMAMHAENAETGITELYSAAKNGQAADFASSE